MRVKIVTNERSFVMQTALEHTIRDPNIGPWCHFITPVWFLGETRRLPAPLMDSDVILRD